MRNLWLLISLLLLFALEAGAQAKVKNRDIRRATQEAVDRYALDDAQAERMTTIQKQRLFNLASIEALKQRDYEQYLRKKRAIRLYVESATRRLLRKDQLRAFDAMKTRRAAAREALLRQLKTENATPEARRSALLRLEEASWE